MLGSGMFDGSLTGGNGIVGDILFVFLVVVGIAVTWNWLRGPETASKRRQRVREYIETQDEGLGV